MIIFLKKSLYVIACSLLLSACTNSTGNTNTSDKIDPDSVVNKAAAGDIQETNLPAIPPIDSLEFRKMNLSLANGDTTGRWPASGVPIPLPGATLPYHRIIAYYGNIYSKRMGALGEYPPAEMWSRLDKEVAYWNKVDSTIEAVPALHYIAVVASDQPGKSGKYRNRMPFHQIDSVLTIAKTRDALVFLDIQVGLGSLQEELPELEKYLSLPHVHLGIDPEFSMKDGSKPGKKIGSFHAEDINYATEYLASLVQKHNLPPKMLVVHRFTKGMVKNYKDIKRIPEVQFILHMDGWGSPELKKGTYRNYIYPEPIEYTGFKIFYKNDIKAAPHRLITPEELLKLKPIPIYIQYQ